MYTVGEDGDTMYLVMELVMELPSGEPLSDRIERGTLPVQEAIPVALGILAALDSSMHSKNV